jgi:tripartite-type tricarboxylate transporter receptor subunit TctC
MLVGFPAGGSADSVARLVGEKFSSALGQQFVVENKPGASGNIATLDVLNAPADGQTVYLTQLNLATNPSIMDVGYDPLTALRMVSQFISVPVVMLTNPKSGLKTVSDVVALAKTKNGELKFGGVLGTSSHLCAEILAIDQDFKFKLVPYKGGALAVQALMSEEVDVVFDLMSGTLKGLLDAGELHAAAVMQDTPVAGLEGVVPAGDQGVTTPAFFRSWMGLSVRAGTPEDIVATLHKASSEALADPGLRSSLEALGAEIRPSASPDEFQQFYLSELQRFGDLIRTIGYQPE